MLGVKRLCCGADLTPESIEDGSIQETPRTSHTIDEHDRGSRRLERIRRRHSRSARDALQRRPAVRKSGALDRVSRVRAHEGRRRVRRDLRQRRLHARGYQGAAASADQRPRTRGARRSCGGAAPVLGAGTARERRAHRAVHRSHRDRAAPEGRHLRPVRDLRRSRASAERRRQAQRPRRAPDRHRGRRGRRREAAGGHAPQPRCGLPREFPPVSGEGGVQASRLAAPSRAHRGAERQRAWEDGRCPHALHHRHDQLRQTGEARSRARLHLAHGGPGHRAEEPRRRQRRGRRRGRGDYRRAQRRDEPNDVRASARSAPALPPHDSECQLRQLALRSAPAIHRCTTTSRDRRHRDREDRHSALPR
jgi:hypothetical protein